MTSSSADINLQTDLEADDGKYSTDYSSKDTIELDSIGTDINADIIPVADASRDTEASSDVDQAHDVSTTVIAGDVDCAVDIDSLEQRVKLVADSLKFSDGRAWFLAAMFNPAFYAATYGLEHISKEQLFSHFLNEGIRNDYTPSPVFDPAFTKSQIDTRDIDSHNKDTQIQNMPVMVRWLNEFFTTITPHALFDGNFYLDQYSDLAESVDNPYAHFATNGIYEDRVPCEFLSRHINAVCMRFDGMQANISTIFSSLPVGYSEQFLQSETQTVLTKIFMPELYKAQLENKDDLDPEVLYSHFLVSGCLNHHRPTALFNTRWYLEQLNSFTLISRAIDTLQEFRALSLEQTEQLQRIGTCSPFLHWFFSGMQLGIVPTPLFDTDHYTMAHHDIRKNWDAHPFMHFIETGYKEPFRRYSSIFDTNYYQQQIGKLTHSNAILDFILCGQHEEISPTPGLQLQHFIPDDPLASSSLEEAAIYFKHRLAPLESSAMRDMIEKATKLEPQLVRPYGARIVRMAPIFHPETSLMHNAKDVVVDLQKVQYDVIVLMPHCRMAGSANVAGQFTQSLSNLIDGEKILVITTDLAAFERPDWFPDSVDVFDLSEHTSELPQERKIRILLDVVRGLRPKKLVNINSNLGWHLTNTFGKQISAWMDIYFYLFCWDRDQRGNKGGYPIQWFLPTFNYAKAVFTDNTVLQSELQERYCLSDAMRKKIVALHTPATEIETNYMPVLTGREQNTGVRRIFWSGRFDRQKRIDVLFAIANRMPKIEFWVWGKTVLDDSEVSIDAAPKNVRLMGTYTSFDDLPVASCDCFLYTSGWDGLPVILIDVASRGIPIVASAVGGVEDLVNDKTGWPIADYANPDAYCDSINELLGDYSQALAKAQSGREHALTLCSKDKYNETLSRTMDLNALEHDDCALQSSTA